MENQREISKRMIEVARQCMAGDSPTEDAESLEEAVITRTLKTTFKYKSTPDVVVSKVHSGKDEKDLTKNYKKWEKLALDIAGKNEHGDKPIKVEVDAVKESVDASAESLEEANIVSLDRVPFDGEPDEIANLEKKYGIMIKIVDDSTISLTGDKKRIMKYLTSKDYGLNTREAQELFTFQWYSTPR